MLADVHDPIREFPHDIVMCNVLHRLEEVVGKGVAVVESFEIVLQSSAEVIVTIAVQVCLHHAQHTSAFLVGDSVEDLFYLIRRDSAVTMIVMIKSRI